MVQQIDGGKYERDQESVYRQLEAQELILTNRKWFAYLSAEQSNIAVGSWEVIEFDSLVYDCGGAGFSSYGYPVQEKGIYDVDLNVVMNSPVANVYYVFTINSGGVVWRRNGFYNPNQSAQYRGMFLSCHVEADVGDVIQGYVQQISGGVSADLNGGSRDYTSMNIHLLSRSCR